MSASSVRTAVTGSPIEPRQTDTCSQSSAGGPRKARANKVANLVLDCEGDVILYFSTDAGDARFRVSSQVLRLSSSVFRVMLDVKSGFKEGKFLADRFCNPSSSPPLEVPLPEDNPNAFGIILRAIHLHSKWVPDSLTPEQLYEIAIICDKYDFTEAIDFWLKQWIPKSFNGILNMDKWLFMAFAFGKHDIFAQLSKELILSCGVDIEGNLRVEGLITEGQNGATFTLDTRIPESITEEIQRVQQQACKCMVDCVNRWIGQYVNSSQVKCTHQSLVCDSLVLGCFTAALRRLHLVVPPGNSTSITSDLYLLSVKTLTFLLTTDIFPDYIIIGKPTGGCCSTPTFKQYGSVNHKAVGNCSSCVKCSSCHSRYKAPTEQDHSKSCFPTGVFKQELGCIVNKIQGLNYGRFVRSRQESQSYADARTPPVDLWNCLQYQ
ncbi:hypothetical protein EV426DRAFT_629526 [Tirmania nivea]|nr:hypothetical protein EV426DRAFT_629526 [Tirmania nivea]